MSQPGIRGLTKRQNPMDPNQGLPGQDLLWPGEFVLGYPTQDAGDQEAIGDDATPPADWMRNGSYMVWRRLEQKVVLFHDTVAQLASVNGMDAGLLAARMVGRWPSGAPLVIAPLQDDPSLGADDMQNNHFEFGADQEQRRCPYAAHIRKTYPRDDLGRSFEAFVQTRRLRRAGIPFGPEVTSEEEDTTSDQESRGLMFVCYQRSIAEQFEFVQRDWANATSFPFGKSRPAGGGGGGLDPLHEPGQDPIIGQLLSGSREMDEPIPNYPLGNTRSALSLPNHFVTASAGAYFFVPSVPALRAAPLGA